MMHYGSELSIPYAGRCWYVLMRYIILFFFFKIIIIYSDGGDDSGLILYLDLHRIILHYIFFIS